MHARPRIYNIVKHVTCVMERNQEGIKLGKNNLRTKSKAQTREDYLPTRNKTIVIMLMTRTKSHK